MGLTQLLYLKITVYLRGDKAVMELLARRDYRIINTNRSRLSVQKALNLLL